MRFDLLTIFPGYFASPLGEALVGKAIDDGLLDVRVVDLRLFSDDPHRKVDDESFGGGPGWSSPPRRSSRRSRPSGPRRALRAPHVVYLSPRGRRLDAAIARELAGRERLVLVCGRYEGIDERIREAGLFDEEVSLGDFVLPGGEVAALALVEAVIAFRPRRRRRGRQRPPRQLRGRPARPPALHAAPRVPGPRRARGAPVGPSRADPALAA